MWYHEIFFTLMNLHFKLIASIEIKNAALIICVISWITIADTGLTAKNLASIEQSIMSHRIRGAIFVVHLTVNIVHSRTTDRQYAMVSSECYVSSDVIFNPTTDSSYDVTIFGTLLSGHGTTRTKSSCMTGVVTKPSHWNSGLRLCSWFNVAKPNQNLIKKFTFL